jgi:hypothetical protein
VQNGFLLSANESAALVEPHGSVCRGEGTSAARRANLSLNFVSAVSQALNHLLNGFCGMTDA